MSLTPMVTAVVAASLAAASVAAETATTELEQVTVVGISPYGSATTDATQVAGSAQSADNRDLEQSHATDLSAFLARRLGSVYVNENQGNPLQADVNFRGFTASPLLGTPQGLSVYLDGVRLNQAFGDVVSWDLIPRQAIARLDLTSGANPLFGANSLGGALSLRTKDGYLAPGTQLAASGGSHDHRQFELETGGHAANGLDWYVTANRFRDAGWRDFSPTDAKQVFAKLGWRGAHTVFSLTGAYARSDLSGNGLQEFRMLEQAYASAYTLPDETQNRSGLLNLAVKHDIAEGITVSGNAWYRRLRTRTYNGDINEASLAQSLYQPNAQEQAALQDAFFTGFPTSGESSSNTAFPKWRCIANALRNDEPNEKCNGLINRASLWQRNAGAAMQLEARSNWLGLSQHVTAGLVQDESRIHFLQSTQFGYLNPDRSITGVTGPGAFADGTQNSENAFDARVDLSGHQRMQSAYFADAIDLTPSLRANLMARYDRTTVENQDAITPGGGTGSLDGTHDFSRLNPSLGMTYAVTPLLSAYASYGESSRTPSSIELGCADPAAPCRLPNSMAGDPPLSQVVTKTIELGLRGSLAGLRWSAGLFRADNHDDILFVADDQSGFGYFRNVDKTRREGIELGLDGQHDALSFGLHYTYLTASFQSKETLNGGSNSSNEGPAPGFEGAISIAPGDRLSQVPRQIIKAYAEWQALPSLSLSADFSYTGDSLARGNENGLHRPDGIYYLGEGGIGGYAVLNLGGEWKATSALTAWAQIDNLLGRRYATASQLGAVGFDPTGRFISRPFAGPVIDGERPLLHSTFIAPGQPRHFTVGLRYRFAGF